MHKWCIREGDCNGTEQSRGLWSKEDMNVWNTGSRKETWKKEWPWFYQWKDCKAGAQQKADCNKDGNSSLCRCDIWCGFSGVLCADQADPGTVVGGKPANCVCHLHSEGRSGILCRSAGDRKRGRDGDRAGRGNGPDCAGALPLYSRRPEFAVKQPAGKSPDCGQKRGGGSFSSAEYRLVW